jgi:holo-[acyl-carrier protein] synthase
VPQTGRVADFMHGLLQRALKEHIPVRRFPVELAAQPVQGDDGDPPLLVGIAEDVAVRRLVKIVIRNCENEAAAVGMIAQNLRGERGEKHLAAGAVQSGPRNRKRAIHGNGEEETFLQAETQSCQEGGVDCVDRNDAQCRFHPGAVSFDADAKGPRMAIVGIGIDLAEVARYRFAQAKLEWFARKVYTDEEIAYAMRKRDPSERLAGFFAAKEATRKAFGHAIPWRQVGVSHERTGKPAIRLDAAAARLLEPRGVDRIHLTITHTNAMAAAVVVLERL